MDKSSKIYQAALKKYLGEKNNIQFYAEGIDPDKSNITSDGSINLFHQYRRRIVAKYQLADLDLSSEEINKELGVAPSTKTSATSAGMDTNVITIDMSNKRMLLGISASIAMLIGALCPVATLPIVGNINYVANGRGDGVFIIALSLVSIFFSVTERYKLLRYTGCASLTLMFFTLFRFQFAISEVNSSMAELAGNPFRGLAEAAVGSFGLGWGWLLLITGAVTILITSFLEIADGRIFLRSEYLNPTKAGNFKENILILGTSSFLIGLLFAAMTSGL
jgi:hypothetical protein